MKASFVFILLFAAIFSLPAETDTNILIYVSNVTGKGSDPDDNTLFTEMIINEVRSREIGLVDFRRGADFFLQGKLGPYKGEEGVEAVGGQYVLHLFLKNATSGKVLDEEQLVYTSMDGIREHFPLVMFSIFSRDLNELKTDDDWRNQWLYLGAGLFWTPRLYSGDEFSAHLANLGGGISFPEIFIFRNRPELCLRLDCCV